MIRANKEFIEKERTKPTPSLPPTTLHAHAHPEPPRCLAAGTPIVGAPKMAAITRPTSTRGPILDRRRCSGPVGAGDGAEGRQKDHEGPRSGSRKGNRRDGFGERTAWFTVVGVVLLCPVCFTHKGDRNRSPYREQRRHCACRICSWAGANYGFQHLRRQHFQDLEG